MHGDVINNPPGELLCVIRVSVCMYYVAGLAFGPKTAHETRAAAKKWGFSMVLLLREESPIEMLILRTEYRPM